MERVYTEYFGFKISKKQRASLEKLSQKEGVNIATILRWLIDGKLAVK